MKKFLKYALCILVSNLFAISDKVAIVINNEVITEMVLDHYVENFAKVSGNMEQIHDSGFRNYATKMMVTSHLIASFARANEITLTPEEEVRALTQLMEAQGKRIEDFDAVAKEHGIDATWMREFILSNVLQQKVGMLAVAPSVKLDDDAVMIAKQRFLDENTEYKLKVWTIGHGEPSANISAIKTIKQQWASTGSSPLDGEVQDLGWKRQLELPKLFIQALDGVEAGNLVGPVKSEYGYHLVWFEKEHQPDLPTDSEVYETLMQEKYMQEYSEWLEGLSDHNAILYK